MNKKSYEKNNRTLRYIYTHTHPHIAKLQYRTDTLKFKCIFNTYLFCTNDYKSVKKYVAIWPELKWVN